MLNLNGIQKTVDLSVTHNVSLFKLNKSMCDQALEVNVEVVDAQGCLLDQTKADGDNDDIEGEKSDYDLVMGFLKETYLNKFIKGNQEVN